MATAKVSLSHVHFYCDRLKELSEYKSLETKLNAFAKLVAPQGDMGAFSAGADVAAGRKKWLELSKEHGNPITGDKAPENFVGAGQDVVEQMIVGLGFRITGVCEGSETRTFALTSPDAEGAKMIVTAHTKLTLDALAAETPAKKAKGMHDCFDSSNLARFAKQHVGREGCAVLGFVTDQGGVEKIRAKYAELHPNLLVPDTPYTHGHAKILEVFAYYKGEKGKSDTDLGTVLRFVEGSQMLPGIGKVEATFDGITMPAFSDHWVSNVVSRTGFLDTLEETLGFTPKVDFNAGVVAAGEAQIESTVTGNNPGKCIPDVKEALKDQSQVYLPINNALSEVGHVHHFLQELGQGVQHIASRVEDLPLHVQKANDYRKMTGAGLSFLSIPRSYYGSLTVKSLSQTAGITVPVAERCVEALRKAGIVDAADIVEFDVTLKRVEDALPSDVDKAIATYVLRARYGNLYALLRDHISEEVYLRIARNNVLVDVQGDDLLLQIFTSSVLQRKAGQQAPFLEFIQRICSQKKDPATGKPRPMKPGCGGFGIRNFLTLFLSIEVDKATKNRAEAEAAGKKEAATYYGSMVDAFTLQLNESNPVLTAISDAMTGEGEALDRGDTAEASKHTAAKEKGQQQLQEISTKYKNTMKALREQVPASVLN